MHPFRIHKWMEEDLTLVGGQTMQYADHVS